MDSKNWKARLKKIKDYKAAKESADQQGGTLEDGRYKGKITSAQLAESQTSGREQINIFGEISEGDSEGSKFSLFPGLDEKSLPFTLSLFSRLGYGIPEQPEDIVDLVTQLNDDQPTVVIAVKNGWTNIVGLIEGEEGTETSDTEETETETEEVEEVEEDTTSEEEVSEGSKVSFDWKGTELSGEVVEIIEAENKLVVKDENGKKYKISAEKASLVSEEKAEEEVEAEEETEEEVEEEPTEEPAPKQMKGKAVAKATKKAPAKKVSRKK